MSYGLFVDILLKGRVIDYFCQCAVELIIEAEHTLYMRENVALIDMIAMWIKCDANFNEVGTKFSCTVETRLSIDVEMPLLGAVWLVAKLCKM